MKPSHAVTGGLALVAVLATGACGSRFGGGRQMHAADAAPPASATTSACPSGSGFALSLAPGTGGQPTPVRAAEWFAHHGGVQGIPDAGWHEVSRGNGGAVVASGAVRLHVIQGADREWQVDSGERCP